MEDDTKKYEIIIILLNGAILTLSSIRLLLKLKLDKVIE